MWTKQDLTEVWDSTGSDVSLLKRKDMKIKKEIISHKCESFQVPLTLRSVLSSLPRLAASNDWFLNLTTGKWVYSGSWRSLPAQLPSPLTFKIDRVWCGFNQVLNVSCLLAQGGHPQDRWGRTFGEGTCLSEEALRFAKWLRLLAKHARHFTANNHMAFSIASFIRGTAGWMLSRWGCGVKPGFCSFESGVFLSFRC